MYNKDIYNLSGMVKFDSNNNQYCARVTNSVNGKSAVGYADMTESDAERQAMIRATHRLVVNSLNDLYNLS